MAKQQWVTFDDVTHVTNTYGDEQLTGVSTGQQQDEESRRHMTDLDYNDAANKGEMNDRVLNTLALGEQLVMDQTADGSLNSWHTVSGGYRAADSWQGGHLELNMDDQPLPSREEDIKVKDYTLLTVLVCLVFFFPIGIFAFMFVLEAKKLQRLGRLREAREKSKIAFKINMLGIFMGCLMYGFLLLLLLVWKHVKLR